MQLIPYMRDKHLSVLSDKDLSAFAHKWCRV